MGEKKKKKGDVRFFFNYESRTEEVGVQTYLSLQNLPSFIFQICFLFWPKLKKKNSFSFLILNFCGKNCYNFLILDSLSVGRGAWLSLLLGRADWLRLL